jgi:hypothetical protein
MMKIEIVLATLLILGACTKPVQVPTEAEFEANPKLLADWMQKCTSGEYSSFNADEQLRMCGSARSASTVLAHKDISRKNAQLFN